MTPMRNILILVAMALVVVGPAAASSEHQPSSAHVTFVAPDGQIPQPFQRWADNALVPTPAVTITLHLEQCASHVSDCYGGPDIWLDLRNETRRMKRYRFFHELGHAFDDNLMDDYERAAYMRIRHIGPSWYATDPHGDRTGKVAPSEDFPEAWATCAIYRRITGWTDVGTSAAYQPTPRQHRRVCALIRRASRTPLPSP